MNLRRFRLILLLYVGFDLFFGGICGGFFQLTPLMAAQFTTVSGTVTDPNGLPYANGTITPALVISSSPKFTATNQPYTPPSQPVGLSSAGSFVMQLADVTALTPGGGTYSFTVSCAAGCVPVAGGKGPVTFTVIGVTISGASQSITAALTAAALALTNPSAGGIPANPASSIQFNNAGAFGGDANLTWNNSTKQLQYGTSVGPSTFSIASNAYITGFPLTSFFTTTTDGTSTGNGPLAIPNNFSMNINPATGSQTTEAWTLNSVAFTDPSNTSTFLNELVGFHGEFDHRGSGNVANGFGVSGEDFNIGSGSLTFETGTMGNSGTWTGSTGNVSTAQGLVGLIWNAGSGTITNGYGLHIFAHTTPGATGTITNMTGIQIDDVNVVGVTNPLAINVAVNDSNLGPGHVKMGIAQITAAANDSAPPLGFQAGGFTSNIPGFEANGLGTSSAILYGVVNGTKLMALDFNFGLTMVDQSGLGFASSGLVRNSGFFPLGAAKIACGNGANSDTTCTLVGGTLQFPTLLAGNVASGTNNVGVDLTLQSSNGTGNATPSHIKLLNPAFSSTSGTTVQSPVTTYIVHKKAGSTTSGTATNMFQIPVAANQTIGAEIIVHVETTQATPQNCSTTETFVAAAQNTSSTVTQQTTAGTIGTICSTGTLTLTAAFSTATPSVFSVTPSWTTIVPTAVIISVEIHNLSQQDITTL